MHNTFGKIIGLTFTYRMKAGIYKKAVKMHVKGRQSLCEHEKRSIFLQGSQV